MPSWFVGARTPRLRFHGKSKSLTIDEKPGNTVSPVIVSFSLSSETGWFGAVDTNNPRTGIDNPYQFYPRQVVVVQLLVEFVNLVVWRHHLNGQIRRDGNMPVSRDLCPCRNDKCNIRPANFSRVMGKTSKTLFWEDVAGIRRIRMYTMLLK